MDFLQIALIFLIALLTILLTITGVQVFFILRDLKKALEKLNTVLFADELKDKLLALAKKSARSQLTTRRLFRKSR